MPSKRSLTGTSSLPQSECARLKRLLGTDLLAGLIGVSASSVQRYATGVRTPSPAAAARLHFLASLVGTLGGAYDEDGVRRWFGRPRTQLDGQSPAEQLQRGWNVQDDGPIRVLHLAAALLGAPAT